MMAGDKNISGFHALLRSTKAPGHMAPSLRFAESLKLNIAYLSVFFRKKKLDKRRGDFLKGNSDRNPNQLIEQRNYREIGWLEVKDRRADLVGNQAQRYALNHAATCLQAGCNLVASRLEY